jgi:plastocyanin
MEGESITVNFTAPEPNGTTLYFVLTSVNPPSDADFTNETGNTSGTPYYEATVNNAAGSFTVTTAVDTTVESENFVIQLRTGDEFGTVQATSSTVTIQNPTITPSTTTPNEGDTVTFSIVGRPNHTYVWFQSSSFGPADWAITGGGTYQGFANITTNSSGTASFQLDVVADNTTEGNETYTFSLHPDASPFNPAVATTGNIVIQDTSTSSYSIEPNATNQTHSENNTATSFSISADPSTIYYVTVNHLSTSPGDFLSGHTGGSITTNGAGDATWFIIAKNDGTTEGNETYQLELRTGSASGTVVATSATTTISDTSTNPSLTEQSYYEMHLLRTLTGQSASWSTYTDSLSSHANTNGRLVFAYQNGTSGTSYQGDIQIDDIAFSDTSSGQGYNYSFELQSHGWETSTSTAMGMELGTSDAALRTFQDNISSYSTISNSVTATSGRWNRDSGGTSSSGTGLTTADDRLYYLYAETSGSSTGGHYYTACTPLIDLDSGPGSVSYAVARSGGNIGTLKVYWAENKSTDPYTGGGGGGTFNPTNIALINRDRFNGSTSSSTSFWYSNGGGLSSPYTATVYGNWPSGPANGTTCKVVVVYKSYNYWRGDFQIDDCYANATSDTAGGSNLNIDVAGTSGWRKGTTRRTYSSTSMPNSSDVLTHVQNDSFTTVSSGTTTGTWNIDSGGTPSSGTGASVVGSGNYIYWEASTSGRGYSYKYVPLVSPEFTIDTSNSSNGVRMKLGVYGTHFGRCQVYLIW